MLWKYYVRMNIDNFARDCIEPHFEVLILIEIKTTIFRCSCQIQIYHEKSDQFVHGLCTKKECRRGLIASMKNARCYLQLPLQQQGIVCPIITTRSMFFICKNK